VISEQTEASMIILAAKISVYLRKKL